MLCHPATFKAQPITKTWGTVSYHRLLDALTGLDRDPAHPEPMRDRIAEVLGEVSSIWPASVRLEQAA